MESVERQARDSKILVKLQDNKDTTSGEEFPQHNMVENSYLNISWRIIISTSHRREQFA